MRQPFWVGLEESQDVGGREAVGAEGAEGEGVVALGEADTMDVAHEVAVEVGGGGVVESALEEDLAGGGLEEVSAADDLGDGCEGVVDYARELVAGEADVGGVRGEGLAPDEEVAEVGGGGEGLRAGVEVGEGDGRVVGGAEAVIRIGRTAGVQEIWDWASWAAAVVVEGLVIGLGCGVFVRRVGGEREVTAGAGAGVGETGGEELLEGGEVEGEASGLTQLGVPGEAEPVEVLAHGGGELGARALGIEVFVAEVKGAVGDAGALVGDEEGAGVAEVEKAGGRGSETAGVGRGGHGAGTTRAFSVWPGIQEMVCSGVFVGENAHMSRIPAGHPQGNCSIPRRDCRGGARQAAVSGWGR